MGVYLVTGGAGFIGSHIVDYLLSKGETVRVLDNFSTGKMKNIEHNLEHIELIRGNLEDMPVVRQAVKGVNYILHHAAEISVPGSVDDPIACNEKNVTGTLNILVAARDAGVKRLVLATSSAVYGDNPIMPKKEDMPGEPLSPYALTKLTGEFYCKMFTSLYGFETVCLRYFNVFGPRQDPMSMYAAVIPKFISSMLEGKSPTIFGDGLQSRDFTYVSNNVEANYIACHAPNAAGEIFNIATGESFSLLDLMNAINNILGTSIEPVFGPVRAGDIKYSSADVSKARDLLGFIPSISFSEGLEKLVKWYMDSR